MNAHVGMRVYAISDGCVLGEAVVLGVDPVTKTLTLDREIPQLCAGVELMYAQADPSERPEQAKA